MATSGGYIDFELLIERAETRYRARVLTSPVGTGAGPFFDLPELGGNFGRRLFQAVFAGSVRELWLGSLGSVGRNLRLQIRLEDDPHLLSIPWELLDDPDRGVIGVERPLVRTLEGPIIPRLLPVRGPLKILAILSCPPGMASLDLDEEWRVLDRMLGPLVAAEQVVLEKLVQPTPERIRRALRAEDWQVLHFVGHGLGGALIVAGPNEGAWPVGDETLGVLFNEDSLRLVVLNACAGACPGPGDPFSSVARTLVKRGVPAVLAMQQEVSDAAAIAFAEHFYGALSRSFLVDAALAEARRELYSRDDLEWAVPVLYLSAPDGRLVEPADRAGFCPGPWWWGTAALAVLATLVMSFFLGRAMGASEPGDPSSPPPIVQTPRECPSPEGLNMAFVKIGPGIFKMGHEKGEDNDEPVHDVSITRAFCLGAFEMTREQWDRVLGGVETSPAERYFPVRGVSFNAAQEFIRRLNDKEPSRPYRLPTEAEWEFAARAGSSTTYSFGDDPKLLPLFGNCKGKDSFDSPAPVGRFPRNDFGLYDMYGNVFEWVEDWYAPYPEGRVTDPRGPVEGERRIRRGGSWDSGARACSSAARSDVDPDRKDLQNGFRIVREIR